MKKFLLFIILSIEKSNSNHIAVAFFATMSIASAYAMFRFPFLVYYAQQYVRYGIHNGFDWTTFSTDSNSYECRQQEKKDRRRKMM